MTLDREEKVARVARNLGFSLVCRLGPQVYGNPPLVPLMGKYPYAFRPSRPVPDFFTEPLYFRAMLNHHSTTERLAIIKAAHPGFFDVQLGTFGITHRNIADIVEAYGQFFKLWNKGE